LDSGRAVRFQESEIPIRGIQAINRREGEVVVGAVMVESTCEIALITAGGYGKRMPVEWIPVPAKPNSRGKVVVARRKVRGVIPADPETDCWAITSNGLLPFTTDDISQDASLTTRSHRFLNLPARNEIVAVITQ
jgi:DNA gyrase/topoisomerase IV subunit A